MDITIIILNVVWVWCHKLSILILKYYPEYIFFSTDREQTDSLSSWQIWMVTVTFVNLCQEISWQCNTYVNLYVFLKNTASLLTHNYIFPGVPPLYMLLPTTKSPSLSTPFLDFFTLFHFVHLHICAVRLPIPHLRRVSTSLKTH